MAPMTPEEIVGIGREALYVAIQVASPILIVGLIIGLTACYYSVPLMGPC